jgi:hypothetical protein
MSATGSVVIRPSLPASLHDARDFALEREASKTDTAHLELSQSSARAATDPATIALADFELQLFPRFCDLTGARHVSRSP